MGVKRRLFNLMVSITSTPDMELWDGMPLHEGHREWIKQRIREVKVLY